MILESHEKKYSISLILTVFQFFLFDWRFADRHWNVVILLAFQVPVPFFDLIFGVCDTCRCEITYSFFPMILESHERNIAFCLFLALFQFFLFDWRFADWSWNVIILLTFQVPVRFFDLIFGICDTCRCEIIYIFCWWFRKVMKANIAFLLFLALFQFFWFDWRFADWPWNVVILLAFQVPTPFFKYDFRNLRHL